MVNNGMICQRQVRRCFSMLEVSFVRLTELAFSRAAPSHGKSDEPARYADRGSERRRVGCTRRVRTPVLHVNNSSSTSRMYLFT